MGFRLSVPLGGRLGQLSSMPWKSWGATGSVVSWADRPVGVPSCLTPLRPAAPLCAALPRPAHVNLFHAGYVWVLGATIRKYLSMQNVSGNVQFPASKNVTCRIQNPDIPRLGRVGAHGRAAGWDPAGWDADRTVRPGRIQASPAPPKASKTCLLNDSPEARTSEIPCKTMGEPNERLTTG